MESFIIAEIPPTHEFVYSGHLFPFNISIVSAISNKIKQNLKQYQQHKQIQLIKTEENKIKLLDDSITDFISFCHCQTIKINNNNVFDLNYLAIEYDIPQLIEATNQYIINHKELILKQSLFNMNLNRSDNILYEEAISQRLVEFINDDDLLKLPIPSIHRILQKSSNLNDDIKFNFLCKCLNKYGKQASVLFINFNFNSDNIKYLIKLISESQLSQNFDLSYIKNEAVRSLFNYQEKKIEEMKQEFETYKKHHKIKSIKALYIVPPNMFTNTQNAKYDPFDIDFIHKLNNKDATIHIDTITESKIIDVTKNIPIILDLYNVIIFGNGDRGGRYTKLDYVFFDLVKKYRDNGGSILMLHDFNHGQYKDRNGNPYDIFNDDLGYKTVGNMYFYDKCKFNPPDWMKEFHISDIISFPYKIDFDQNQSFDAALTHETITLDSKFKVIESSLAPQYHYYSENPKKRVADCEMGHDRNLTEIEKKLLFNIIYHLSQLN